MKTFSLLFALITLFLVQPTECGAGIIVRGLVGVTKAGLRQGAVWTASKAKEDPQVAAGAVAGAYVGYRVSERDSKMLGAIAGAFVGAKLVKNHKNLKTLEAQLQAQMAQVSVLTQESAVQFATLEVRLAGLGRQVTELGQCVADVVRKNMVQQRVVVRKTHILDHITSQTVVQKAGIFGRLKNSGWMKKMALAAEPQNLSPLASM